ncbi:MAG: class I SAM-dependent rRNA methyltransferase [Thermodesulfobacteriota bacterium]
MSATLTIKKGGLRSLARGHPWVFARAVERVQGRLRAGQVARLIDGEGRFLAWAWGSPESHIRARVLDHDPDAVIDSAWLAGRLERALAKRAGLEPSGCTAYRLVNAESDGLPGLIVDRLGPGLVLQALSAGAEAVKREVADWLARRLGPEWIWERSDQEVRRLEGLEPLQGPLHGPEPGRVLIAEPGCRYWVEPAGGQKTGFYLDQRENRRLVAAHAAGRSVLDCFCYSGGFAIHALMAGADSAVLVDSSAQALALAAENLALNQVEARAELVRANVFELLRGYRDQGRRFGLIILDPPKLAPSRAVVEKAARAYKDLNMMALRLLEPDGVLATFSCSAGMDREFFGEVLTWAAEDARLRLQLVAHLGQPGDHPARLGFPESQYLKGLVLRPL